MELYIAEMIAERRKSLNLTQEELSQRIGVSAQAVSNWERRAGYPDVMILPSLASALGISTDELLGIGRRTDREIFEQFKEDMQSITDPCKFKTLVLKSCHAYPNNYYIMEWIIWIVYREFRSDSELVQLAKELGRRILNECTDTKVRLTARKTLAFICDDDEAKEYIDTFDDKIMIRPNIIGRRTFDTGKAAEAREWFDLEIIMIMGYVTGRSLYCAEAPATAVKYCEFLTDLVKTFGKDCVPDGWFGCLGILQMRHAAALFDTGCIDAGYKKLEEALDSYEKWYSFPIGEELSLGRLSPEGNVKIKRTDDGSDIFVGNVRYAGSVISEVDVMKPLLPEYGWHGFEIVREDVRFKDMLRRAKKISTRTQT